MARAKRFCEYTEGGSVCGGEAIWLIRIGNSTKSVDTLQSCRRHLSGCALILAAAGRPLTLTLRQP